MAKKMRSAAVWLAATTTGVARGACAASLADVCTTAYVQSVLPADNFLAGTTLSKTSVTANAVTGYTVAGSNLIPPATGINFCNVTFTYSHTALSDETTLWFFLPAPNQYKNRYLSTGGAGLAITTGASGLEAGLPYGAATGTTDAGFGSFNAMISDVLLNADGSINTNALNAFGYLAIHEMTVLGKELTRKFYNADKFYSYYSGCSEGGRDGLSQVQKYGTTFDGAAIGAPAMRQAFQQVAHLYPAVDENIRGYAPPPCELEKINNDTIAFCDALDGKVDGIVSRTDLCKLLYRPQASVGKAFYCAASAGGVSMGGPPSAATPAQSGNVTLLGANIANDVNNGLFDSQGRQIYITPQPSSGYSDGTTSYNATSGKWEVAASGIAVQYVNLFLNQVNSDSLSLDGVTTDTLRAWIIEGIAKFNNTLQTNDPNLATFKANGAKLIHFHGESDSSVPAASSVLYHDSVRKVMYPNNSVLDGYSKLNDWYHLFLVPGAGHCSPGSVTPSPFPQNVVASLIDWVENGNNPKLLNATFLSGASAGKQQQLCSWPLRPFWVGSTMTCVYDQLSFNSWLPTLDSIPGPIY